MALSQGGYKISINQTGSSLSSSKPISLRNVVREGAVASIDNIENIGNVSTVSKTDGAFLQYNAVTNKYEVVQAELDGGTF